ncbi:MAG: hypothetical protein WC635_01400 [Bacteriovorax sp.]
MKLEKILALSLAFITLIPFSLFANSVHAPQNFITKDGQAVFVDFQDAVYNLTYESSSKTVKAFSQINFETSEIGLPLFDMVENPTSIVLDGEPVTNKIISTPDNDTKLRLILKTITPGKHTLEIHSPVTEGISFSKEGVSSAFWYSDLDDRSYLEAYLPANYEYDQYKMLFNIDFKSFAKQRIYTNGKLSKIDSSHFQVEFPESYTSSSAYFHTAPVGRYNEKLFNFHSIDGRVIPVTAYNAGNRTDLEAVKSKTLESLADLEAQYGPFLHSSVTIFNAGSGGMEYCGATMSDLWALNHELTHSYFARGGFMPANGNSGWIDEAVTSWSDDNSPTKVDLGNMKSNMAGHSEYRRYTDMDAYSKGKSFIAHLHYKLQSVGGMTAFLNQLILSDSFKPMTTEEFIKKLSDWSAEDMTPLFKKHVYSGPVFKNSAREKGAAAKRRVHMKMSIKEMAKYL